MLLQTKVELPARLPLVDRTQPILLMGSCFAENMGRRMADAKFRIDVNPYGILYNPLSIAAALGEIVEGRLYREADLFCHQGLWHSPMHHGDFSAPSPQEALEHINRRIEAAHCSFPSLEWLMLTFGTAHVYYLNRTGQPVANCHKLPDGDFARRRLSPDEIAQACEAALSRCFEAAPRLRVMLTVSPVRHLRDGLHANQLSKAALLLAAERIRERNPGRVFYFPSYEIVMDELRDYRFYADDLLHPSPLAAEYLWERFSQACFSAETRRLTDELDALHRDLAHRPFRPGSEAHQRFLGQLALKIEQLKQKYPYLDLEKETSSCHTQLNP